MSLLFAMRGALPASPRCCLLAVLAGLLSGCALPGPVSPAGEPNRSAVRATPVPDGQALTPFSAGVLAPEGAAGWGKTALHPTKPPTVYRIVNEGGKPVLEAVSEASVSGLAHPVDLQPGPDTVIEWTWRIDGTLPGADVSDRHADDSPARLVLAFDGDLSSLSQKEQLFRERVKLFTGQELPYATLMYVWDGSAPVGEIVTNPRTDRIRKIVVESGEQGVRSWRQYRRQIEADYRMAYGKAPGRLVAVGVMTDSDNTRQKARCLYGDIRLMTAPR